jgi:polyphosphate kinase
MFPLEDDRLKLRVVDEILPVILSDNVKARVLAVDGRYQRMVVPEGTPAVRSQLVLQEVAREAARERRTPESPQAPADGSARVEPPTGGPVLQRA